MTNSLPATAHLTLSAFFVALIAVLAQIAVPLPFSPVPFTGQVIGVFLTGIMLPKRAALLTILTYLLIGAAGMPVFSLARGGLYMLTGPSGGYLFGFIPAVLVLSLLLKDQAQPSLPKLIAAMLPALGLIYLVGSLQLGLLMQLSIKQSLLVGVAPFIVFDLAKVLITALLSRQIKKSLHAGRLDQILHQ
ncbi:MAG: biotin transporter BioY [Firmicutes bacterium]|nr:biotin transporter BioY [Bacillota bacterium]